MADDWAQAYARQARADLAAYELLKATPDLPVCQSLHFLQMACEKLVKAHLCAARSRPQDLQTSQAYVAKNLQTMLRARVARLVPRDRERTRWLVEWIKPVAREIELLSPAVTAGGTRLPNCEYPWEDQDGTVRCPADYPFPNLGVLRGRTGVVFLKLLHLAGEELTQ